MSAGAVRGGRAGAVSAGASSATDASLTDASLTARAVTVRIAGRAIVDGVDLHVAPGRVHALVGPNGAGKSTLFSALAGDADPSSGQVLLGGVGLTRIPARERARRRAVLLQENLVSFAFTAEQVVRMGRAPWAGTPAEEDDDRAVADAMAETDVSHLGGRSIPALSGGERARVALARVLAQGADILLLDEPTAALDLRHQEDVLRLARRRADAGAAVAIVVHDLGAAFAVADDVSLLDGGRLIATGAPRDVLTAETIERVWGQPVDVFPHPTTGAPLVVPRR